MGWRTRDEMQRLDLQSVMISPCENGYIVEGRGWSHRIQYVFDDWPAVCEWLLDRVSLATGPRNLVEKMQADPKGYPTTQAEQPMRDLR